MKISEVLTEAQITPYQREELSGEISDILQKHCSVSLSMMRLDPLWRGTRSNNGEILMLDPSKGSRKSENTTNYYTMLMDNSPYMKGWPKRSNSFICSTRREVADSYGTPYAIFPYNGTKIAICPNGDLWDTPVNLSPIGEKKSFWDYINYMMRRLGFESDASWDAVLSYVAEPKFADHLAAMQLGKPDEEQIQPYQFVSWLQERMAPANVGFQLKDITKFNPVEFANKEIWFSGPCIAIRGDIYDAWIRSTT